MVRLAHVAERQQLVQTARHLQHRLADDGRGAAATARCSLQWRRARGWGPLDRLHRLVDQRAHGLFELAELRLVAAGAVGPAQIDEFGDGQCDFLPFHLADEAQQLGAQIFDVVGHGLLEVDLGADGFRVSVAAAAAAAAAATCSGPRVHLHEWRAGQKMLQQRGGSSLHMRARGVTHGDEAIGE